MKVVLYLMCIYHVFVMLHGLADQLPIMCMYTLHELIELSPQLLELVLITLVRCRLCFLGLRARHADGSHDKCHVFIYS